MITMRPLDGSIWQCAGSVGLKYTFATSAGVDDAAVVVVVAGGHGLQPPGQLPTHARPHGQTCSVIGGHGFAVVVVLQGKH